MKKLMLMALAGLFGSSITALGNVERASSLSNLQKKKIAWAIKILAQTGTISEGENQCIELDQDILKTLESEGLIEEGTTRTTSICIGKGS